MGSPILSMYSLNFENLCLVFIRKFFIKVQFTFVSMSHIFIFIYCCGFYLDPLGYIEFEFLVRFYSNCLRLQVKI